MEKTFTIEDLEDYVRDCHLDYAAAGIEVGDPLYEWDNAHHPKSKKLGGTSTIPLMRKDHAVHGVIQSEVYQYPCISCMPWERSYLPERYLDLYEKWRNVQCRMGGEKTVEERVGIHDPNLKQVLSNNGKKYGKRNGKRTVEEGIGIHAPEYRESEECKIQYVEAGKKAVEKGAGFHDPEYRESEEHKQAISSGGKSTSSQKWMCTVTGHVSSPGSLTLYQRARGIDTKNRVRLS